MCQYYTEVMRRDTKPESSSNKHHQQKSAKTSRSAKSASKTIANPKGNHYHHHMSPSFALEENDGYFFVNRHCHLVNHCKVKIGFDQ